MNKANFHAFQREVLRTRFPTSGGVSSLGPGDTARSAQDAQVYWCVRVSLLSGDPHSNGGRDSNGYYVVYQENNRYSPTYSPAPQMRLNATAVTSGSTTITKASHFADGDRVWCYAYSQTTSSPTSTDNGYTLLRPIGQQGGLLLGQWTGSQTITGGVPQVGTTLWQVGQTAPIEIWGGPTAGSETDQKYYYQVMNYVSDIVPTTFVVIGNNGFGWYLVSPMEHIQLAFYSVSPGQQTIWRPGTSQNLVVYTGTPGSEVTTGVTIPSVFNRWGPVAANNYVLIGYDAYSEYWYVIAPQGQALLAQYQGGDLWAYNEQVAAGALKVFGGPTLGSEVDVSWALNNCWNYCADINSTANNPNPWVWVNTNGYTADHNYTLNWYVVNEFSEKSFVNAYSNASPGTNFVSGNLIPWTASDSAGFTSSSSGTGTLFQIPDNRRYLVEVQVRVLPGFSGSVTMPLEDMAAVQLQLYLSGVAINGAVDNCEVGWIAIPTYAFTNNSGNVAYPPTETWHYENPGPGLLVAQTIIDAEEGSTISAGFSTITAVNGSGNQVTILNALITITPFDQG